MGGCPSGRKPYRRRNVVSFSFKMKSVVIPVFACMLAVLSSCEGRSGYLDEGQQTTVTMLTDVEWLMSYADYGYGSVETYDDETRIYKFDKTGKGWFASGSFTDISKKTM